VQNDIKRVLAYSTVSQLGYMFLALGVGAFAAGVFHVFTHAFFKALLFLGAGSVIHAMSGEQDMRNMGDLHGAFPHHSDHVHRDARHRGHFPVRGILLEGRHSLGDLVARRRRVPLLWYVGYVTALMTAFYMFRLMYLTFHGRPRMSHEVEHHIHESPVSMTVPLVIARALRHRRGMAGIGRTASADPTASRNSLSRCSRKKRSRASVERENSAGCAGAERRRTQHRTEWLLMGFRWRRRYWDGAGGARYRHADKGYTEPIAAAAPPVYNVCSTSITWTKATTTSSPAASKVGDVRLGVMGSAKRPHGLTPT
jgi:NADH-quinone oxidoreductase subunit L